MNLLELGRRCRHAFAICSAFFMFAVG